MTNDWRSLAVKIEPKARITAPTTPDAIAEIESLLNASFPADLKELLLQTNGIVDDCYGPVLALSGKIAGPFAGRRAQSGAPEPMLPKHYSIAEYTLLQRSLWEDDAGVNHDDFVVVGLDVGGNPYGFLTGQAGDTRILGIAHDDGSISEGSYTLEEYLRYYFTECRWFNDEH